jgi:hypothetical protein
LQPDFDKSAAAMVAGTQKAIAAAVAPLLKRIEALESIQPLKGDKGDSIKGDPGKDGVGLAGALIDRSGVLVLTLTDGTTRELGEVVGKHGIDADMAAIEKHIDQRIAELPKPKDGEPGRDGFDLEAFDVGVIDERTIELKFTGAGQVHRYELEFPVIVDRGVFKAGESYKRGDAVTWGGSLWIAQMETGVKPDTADSGWRLAVRKGRDGKDK